MHNFNLNYKKIFFTITALTLIGFLNSCGIYKPVDARKVPPDAKSRVKKNLEEGRGFTLMGNKNKSTNFQFASSNPMWRATLEILDFLPLSNVDYSGGIVSTDWYNEGTSSNESLKITIRFLKKIEPETKGKYLLDMEYFLRKDVEYTLELFIEEMKDKSELRRLYK